MVAVAIKTVASPAGENVNVLYSIVHEGSKAIKE